MTKSKNTKRALLASVLSMMLCVAMLVGSTFAWFTDSVTSGKNRIVAGNLDVELYYNNASTDDWADASAASVKNPNFFVDNEGKSILWEPGVMAVTQFKVANVGSLALQYKLATIKADFNAMDGHDLSEVIKFAVIDNADYTADTTREDILALNPEFDDFTGFKAEGNLVPKDNANGDSSEGIFTVVAYWAPTSNDNLYNVNNGQKTDDNKDQLYIDIEIQLLATQYTYENDSFNNQYDNNPEWPTIEVTADSKAWYEAGKSDKTYSVSTPAELTYLATLVNDGTDDFANATINLTKDADFQGHGWDAIGTSDKPFKGTFNGNGHTVSNIVISDNNGSQPCGFFAAIENATVTGLKVDGTMTLAAYQDNSTYGGGDYYEYFGNGGICGFAKNSTISKCVYAVNIDASLRDAPDGYEGGLSIGGVLGCGIGNTTIENCLNVGSIKVSEQMASVAGGITAMAGHMNSASYATVKNCVNAGNNNGKNDMVNDMSGSIAAYAVPSGVVNCYSVNGQNIIGVNGDSDTMAPLTDGFVSNATSLSDFSGLSDQIWEMGSNGYPVLK